MGAKPALVLALLVLVNTLRMRTLPLTVPGQATAGLIVSVTETMKLQALNSPELSVALQAARMLPKGKTLPLVALHAEVWKSVMSLKLTWNLTILLEAPPEVASAADVRQPTLGGVLSLSR